MYGGERSRHRRVTGRRSLFVVREDGDHEIEELVRGGLVGAVPGDARRGVFSGSVGLAYRLLGR